jgi:hypothetical protein
MTLPHVCLWQPVLHVFRDGPCFRTMLRVFMSV